ncbi:hypothetical protein AB4520_15125 [Vibrio renipiscarius]|uniref:hypothetical protein n=1 Tax=Vibrio renipiscarius TaxID=1461322 RepID=UPI00354C3AAE
MIDKSEQRGVLIKLPFKFVISGIKVYDFDALLYLGFYIAGMSIWIGGCIFG